MHEPTMENLRVENEILRTAHGGLRSFLGLLAFLGLAYAYVSVCAKADSIEVENRRLRRELDLPLDPPDTPFSGVLDTKDKG